MVSRERECTWDSVSLSGQWQEHSSSKGKFCSLLNTAQAFYHTDYETELRQRKNQGLQFPDQVLQLPDWYLSFLEDRMGEENF